MKFITRAYNKIELNKKSCTVIKTSNETRLVDEILYYTELPPKLKHYFPNLCATKTSKPFQLELEYYPFDNLGNVLLNDVSTKKWTNVAEVIQYALQTFETFQVSELSSKQFRYDMFIKKTEDEYQKLVSNFPFFMELSKHNTLKINGISYKNFHLVWNRLKEYLEKECCTDTPFTFMHGDMCFSNVLCGFDKDDNAVIKFIDPRGSFGTQGVYGDGYYDLAKLMHSLDAKYEFIIYDKFTLQTNENIVDFTFKNNNVDIIKPIFDEFLFKKFDYFKIKLIQATIMIGMVARHYDSHDRQVVMFSQGVRILNECLEELNVKNSG